eukprot:1964138-Rhodomonas_salina.2
MSAPNVASQARGLQTLRNQGQYNTAPVCFAPEPSCLYLISRGGVTSSRLLVSARTPLFCSSCEEDEGSHNLGSQSLNAWDSSNA